MIRLEATFQREPAPDRVAEFPDAVDCVPSVALPLSTRAPSDTDIWLEAEFWPITSVRLLQVVPASRRKAALPTPLRPIRSSNPTTPAPPSTDSTFAEPEFPITREPAARKNESAPVTTTAFEAPPCTLLRTKVARKCAPFEITNWLLVEQKPMSMLPFDQTVPGSMTRTALSCAIQFWPISAPGDCTRAPSPITRRLA